MDNNQLIRTPLRYPLFILSQKRRVSQMSHLAVTMGIARNPVGTKIRASGAGLRGLTGLVLGPSVRPGKTVGLGVQTLVVQRAVGVHGPVVADARSC